MSVVWNISIGQLGITYLSGCAPSPLLHTCSLAEYGRPEKVLHFLATTKTSVYEKLGTVLEFIATAENVSVLSTFFLY